MSDSIEGVSQEALLAIAKQIPVRISRRQFNAIADALKPFQARFKLTDDLAGVVMETNKPLPACLAADVADPKFQSIIAKTLLLTAIDNAIEQAGEDSDGGVLMPV